MTSTISSVFSELKKYQKINVIDIGACRASFLFELKKVVNLENVFSVGIDPLDHNVSNKYNKFYFACIDDVDTTEERDFFLNNQHDQCSSLCIPTENLKHEFKESCKVQVLNLNSIIENDFNDQIIHFLKIDAEGKDLNIIKSLKEEILQKIKYIAIECPITTKRFDEEYLKEDCINYFKSKNFDLFFCHDTDNGSDLSDVVFVNKKS